MSDKISTIKQLEEQLNLNSNLMQQLTSISSVDSDILILIDEILKLNHATISSIVDYLKNSK